MRRLYILLAARNVPKRRLFSIPGPKTFRTHGVPAWLMLPVIMAAAKNQSLLGPNDLRTDCEALALKCSSDGGCMEGSVPDIGDAAGEQGPCGFPVRPPIIADFGATRGMVHTHSMAPSWIVID